MRHCSFNTGLSQNTSGCGRELVSSRYSMVKYKPRFKDLSTDKSIRLKSKVMLLLINNTNLYAILLLERFWTTGHILYC